MGLKKQKFSLAGMQQLIEYMILHHLIGNPIEYEIRIDNITAIQRTKDIVMLYTLNFAPFKNFKTMEIVLYLPNKREADRLLFTFE